MKIAVAAHGSNLCSVAAGVLAGALLVLLATATPRALPVSPASMRPRKAKNSTTGGNAATSDPVASGPGKPILASATRSESTTVTGLTYSLRVKVEAKISSFQASTKTNAPVANREGAASGMTIEMSTRTRPAPSTFAASSTSAGSSRRR